MNKAELIAAVAAAAEISKKDAEIAVTATLDTITAALKEGDKVQLRGQEPRCPYRPQPPDEGSCGDSRFQGACVQGRQGPEGRCGEVSTNQGGGYAPSFCIFGGNTMRLDKYLKVSRLIKRRTVANEACDNGLVTVNDKPARASYEVKEGDKISLRFGARTITVEVVSVQETVRQSEAAAMYRQV